MSQPRFIPLASLLLLAALATAGGIRADDDPASPPAANPADQPPPRYPLRGVIVEVFPGKGTLLVKHDDVPGVMNAAVMAFRVKGDVFKLVKKGQTITATLIVQEDDFWLTDVKVVKR